MWPSVEDRRTFCTKRSSALHHHAHAAGKGPARSIGCRDGDAWVDSVKDFPRIRGDRFMVLVEFDFEGKRQIFSLDELLEYQAWGISMGPFGFMYRGDPGSRSEARIFAGQQARINPGTDGRHEDSA